MVVFAFFTGSEIKIQVNMHQHEFFTRSVVTGVHFKHVPEPRIREKLRRFNVFLIFNVPITCPKSL